MTEEFGTGHRVGIVPASLPEAQRRRRGVRDALDRLERAVSAPSTGREREWLDGVSEHLSDLQAAFTYHIAVTEAPSGLLNELTEDAPRLAHAADQLRAEHGAIDLAIGRALGAARASDAAEHLALITEAVLNVMAQVVRHRHAGASLVYEAYTVDIDAAD